MTIKVNFGIMFIGFVILLSGVLLLLVSIVWGIISLILSFDLNAPIAFSIAGIVLIAVGITDIVSGVRGWRRAHLES